MAKKRKSHIAKLGSYAMKLSKLKKGEGNKENVCQKKVSSVF